MEAVGGKTDEHGEEEGVSVIRGEDTHKSRKVGSVKKLKFQISILRDI